MFNPQKTRKILVDQYLHPNEALLWLGRPQRALRRGRVIWGLLILLWFALSVAIGLFVDVATYSGLGLIGFALALIFFYMFYMGASRSYIGTGIYYALTNTRALRFTVRSNSVDVQAIGLGSISNIALSTDARQRTTISFGEGEDIGRLQFDDVADTQTLYDLAQGARQQMT